MTETFKSNPTQQKLKVFVGCITWETKDWVGEIYPAGTKASKFWEAYAR